MFLKEIGGIVIFLFAMVILGNLWFSFIESILQKIKKQFGRYKEPTAWHTLQQDEEKHDNE